ncbi:MAG: precorrin-3B C(17)-methyltransferase [Actinomycetota bacterium]|nr:precorrin-3B C(17)-methyltransferase [Actinomycetota bacterium]
MNVLTISLTAAGHALAGRLPYRHRHGSLVATVAQEWDHVDGLVLCCATGIATRAIGPLLADKRSDPAVVVVDEAGRWAVALTGGHAGGSNSLAAEVAALLHAQPVITTASDTAGIPAFDQLPGFRAAGDIAGVTRAWLDGHAPRVDARLDWPLPFAGGDGRAQVIVTDERIAAGDGVVVLCPPSLVVGVGASSEAPAEAAADLLRAALSDAGLDPAAVGLVATIDRRAGDPVVTALGHPVRSFTAGELAQLDVPNPSEIVAAEVGTPSVAEAAALLAAGLGAGLVVAKRKGASATVAVARRRRPVGSVRIVGLGPGGVEHRTPAATAAVRHAEVVIGYTVYVAQCRDLLGPATHVVDSPIGAEVDRCDEALRRAAAGQQVALVCSGDAGIFAMATLVLERAPGFASPPVEVVPGVTASVAAAAVLGAPLAHDHALISLSDLLTPWPVIAARVTAAAEADLVIAFYNPRSATRTEPFAAAMSILADHRPASTPVGIVTNATRSDQHVTRTTLGELDPATVGMFSMVIIGSTTTRVLEGRMVTPRGYQP